MSVSRTLGILATLALLLGVWLMCTSSAAQGGDTLVVQESDHAEPIRLLRSDVDSIAFVVDVPAVAWKSATVAEVAYDVITVSGFGSTSTPGSPQLPTRRVLLGVPLGADFQLRVLVKESERFAGWHRLLPAPTPILEIDPASALGAEVSAPGVAGWEHVEDGEIYGTDALYPGGVAQVAGTGFIRNQRYIAIQVNPVQYNPVSGEVVLHKRVIVEVELASGNSPALSGNQVEIAFEPLLSASLLNYESAASWRSTQSEIPLVASATADGRDVSLPAFKISVEEDGIYEVSAADLQVLGVPVGEILTSTYKLYYLDREVPIRVVASEEGVFQFLWFFGEKAGTKYTDTNVYWLTYDPDPPHDAEPGKRMPTRSVPPDLAHDVSAYHTDTVRLEENHQYLSFVPWVGDPGPGVTDPWDHWFWTHTRYPLSDPYYPPIVSFPFAVSGLSVAEPYSATLRAVFSGYFDAPGADPDHCLEFYVNDEPAGESNRYEWDGRLTMKVLTLAFPSSHLLEGANTVDVHVCERDVLYDWTFYDWFELELRRKYLSVDDILAFDVAEAGWQYRLDGFSTGDVEIFDVSETYAVSHLVDAEITHPDAAYTVAFYDEAAAAGIRYLALTQDQVKRPAAIVQDEPSDLVDTGNHADYIVIAPGVFIPYVQPLVERRVADGLAVQVVDLVSIFDEFNHGIYSPEAIRAFLDYAYHNWAGDPPSYVLLVGDGTYDYKGYLTGANPNLLPPYLAWVDYSDGETAADNRYVTVAGGDPLPDMHIGRLPAETTAQVSTMVEKIIEYETNPAPQDWVERVLFVSDDESPFSWYSDKLVNNYLPEPYLPIKAYFGSTCATGDACKQVILETLNSTGALLVNYIGHGSETQWTGPERVWTKNDLSSLVPTTRLPVMLPMTCDEGSFHEAMVDVLAEETVRIAGKGAVASWSPAGEGDVAGHDYLNTRFLEAVLREGVRELGIATDLGKLEAWEYGYTDLVETYHLFGDPALRLNSLPVVDVAVGQKINAPEVLVAGSPVEVTLTFTNTGPDVAVGGIVTDLLPAKLVDPVLIYASPEVAGQLAGGTLVWALHDLALGTSGTIIFEATVDPSLPSEADFSFINEVRIASQTHDLEPRNNVSWAGVNLKLLYLPLVMKGY